VRRNVSVVERNTVGVTQEGSLPLFFARVAPIRTPPMRRKDVDQVPKQPSPTLPTHLHYGPTPILFKYHRLLTGSGLNPPNSLSALEECLVGGAAALEFDVNVTADQEFVLLHDHTLDRETTGSGPVSSAAFHDVRELLLKGTGERLATLDEVAQRLRQVSRPVKVQVDLVVRTPLSPYAAASLLRSLEPALRNGRLRIVVGCAAQANLRALLSATRDVLSGSERRALQVGFDPLLHLDVPLADGGTGQAAVNAFGFLDDEGSGQEAGLVATDYLRSRFQQLVALVPEATEYYLRAELVTRALEHGFDPLKFIRLVRPAALVDLWTLDWPPTPSAFERMRRLLLAAPDQITTNTAIQWAAASPVLQPPDRFGR